MIEQTKKWNGCSQLQLITSHNRHCFTKRKFWWSNLFVFFFFVAMLKWEINKMWLLKKKSCWQIEDDYEMQKKSVYQVNFIELHEGKKIK